MGRRGFAQAAGLAIGATLARNAFGTPGIVSADDRPNILFAVADDWGWPHARLYGDRVVKTPNFERVASEGALFTHAYCASPSCTPSRGAILTGRMFWELGEGANLWSTLPPRFDVYPDLLETRGYTVGLKGKGWGPGSVEAGGRTRNPAGPGFPSFEEFLQGAPGDKPFCFWLGSTDPHRPYEAGVGVKSGMRVEDVEIPPFLPDAPEVRSDLLDYYWEVQRFDEQVGQALEALEKAGRLENTIVVVTSDNGMPFPRCKTNLYDMGSRLPLAIRWGNRIKAGTRLDQFVSFADFAPTILEAAGHPALKSMTGHSFLPSLLGRSTAGQERDHVFIGRERHVGNARAGGNLGYPMRAIRTRDYLYIWNLKPERWPAADPEEYADVDNGPTKKYMLEHRGEEAVGRLFDLSFGKRPGEELYEIARDPFQMKNLAGQTGYQDVRGNLRARLEEFMRKTGDPRLSADPDQLEKYPYRNPGRRPAK